jgi:hypothetical protein
MVIGKAILTRGLPFLALLVLGCSGEVGTTDEQFPQASAEIVMTYHEGSSSLDIVVDLAEFIQDAQIDSIEMQVDVTIPDGKTERHDLIWTQGSKPEIPRIEMPAFDEGLYDVVLTRLYINGESVRSIDSLAVRQSMELLGDNDSDQLNGNCQAGELIEGTDGSDYLVGTQGKDSMHGQEGPDAMYAGDCGDVIRGGKGNDDLWGEQGNDNLLGGDGNDVCRGGAGMDTFSSCETAIQ